MDHDVFISYSSVDRTAAETVCSILEQNGISCWIAPRDITPGLDFAEAIIDGIKSSKLFVLVYTSSSNNSKQVIREVDRAVHFGLQVINLRLEDVPMSKQLDYYLSSVHWLDAKTPPLEQHIHKLCNVIQMFLKPDEVKEAEITEALRRGIIKQNELDGNGKVYSIAKKSRTVGSGILLTAVITIVSLIVFKIIGGKQVRAGSIESIVILPFGNYTGTDTLDPYISGMHSLLINELGKIKGLRIISKVSSDSYVNTDKSIPQIAKELKVDAAIEVGILSFGDTICMQPRLMSGDTEEKQIWVGDYREAKGNLFNLYNQIIRQIAGEVKVSLTQKEVTMLAESRSVDPEAMNELLRGYSYLDDLSPASLAKARDYLYSAVEKDSEWAPLYSALGTVWYFMGVFGGQSPEIVTSKVYENIDKALKLDPDLAEAHRISAIMAWVEEWNWEKAEKEILEALAINPNHSLSRLYYSFILFTLQRPDEAKMQADFAYKLDPLNPLIQSIYGLTKLNGGDCASSLSVLENVVASDPDYYLAHNYIQIAAFQCGDLDKAFEADKHVLSQLYLFDEELMDEIERIYHEKGFNEAYNEITKQLEILAEKVYISPSDMAFRYYMINEDNKAIDWFEKGAEIHEPGILMLTTIYGSTRLYYNPRFIAICEKMNLPLPKAD
jgi:TolB-like protein